MGRQLRLHIWALFMWVIAIALAGDVRAEPAAETAPPADAPSAEDDPKRVHAERIRALLDGSLPPSADARALFLIRLDDEAFVPLLRAIEAARAQLAAGEPYAPLAGSAGPAEALRAAYVDFFVLPPDEREALLAAHDARAKAHRDAAEAEAVARTRLTALTRDAEQLEAFVAGTLDPEIDPTVLLGVNLLADGEVPSDPTRRTNLLDALNPAGTAAERATPEPTPDVPAPADDTATPPDTTLAPPDDTAAMDAGEPPPAAPAAVRTKVAEATARLDRARAAYLALDDEQRRALVDAHLDRRAAADPEPEEDVPIEFVDVEQEEAREEIADAVLAAEAAAREKEEALEVAREAHTEAMRIVANERARLLGIKEQQARYAAVLPSWRQDAKELHESALEWHRAVSDLAESSGTQTEVAGRADTLYFELRDALATTREDLAEALRRLADPGRDVPSPGRQLDEDELPAEVERADLLSLRRELETQADALRREEIDTGWAVADLLRDDIVLLNHDRLTLLELASRSVRTEVTGLGARGLDQVRRELDQIGLELRYHAMSLPRDLAAYLARVQQNPVDFGLVLVQLLLVLMVFRWWRSRADDILKRWQIPPRRSRPPGRLARVGRRLVWYLRRVRKSVEWLLLLAVFPYLVGDIDAAPELALLWLLSVWTLGGWTAVAVIDAIAARQQYYGYSRTDTARLRFRSLRLLGITVTSIGLILSLTAEIVGSGAIYNWVWQTCWALIAPIGIWLVFAWRSTIFESIAALKRDSGILHWVATTRGGLGGFIAALVGGLYLIGVGTARFLGRYFGDLDATRRVLAYLFRREVLKRAEETAHRPRGPKVDAAIYERLSPHAGAEPVLPGPARDLLEHALELAAADATTMTTIVGERGSGKSTFLRRLVESSDEHTVVVDCPPEGFGALLEVLARAFEAKSAEPDIVAAAIRTRGPCLICIDDAHSMIAPAVGGLAQLDNFTRFALAVGGDVSWMVAVQQAAWNFVQRARGDRVFFDQILELPRWTEAEIGELIRSRTKAAGITPGFDELVVTNVVDESEAAQGRRTEASYYRILWDHSAGNPAVALHAWRESLFTHDDDDEIVVRLFEEPPAAQIERLPLTLLFVLRAVVQLEIGAVPEIALCTQLPEPDVADALRFSVGRGYVEVVAGRYRLAWPWYRTITTVLTRQHLLVA